jgi:hypothetical protein
MMRQDDLIIQLSRMGYRTQVIGGQIVILLRAGSSLSGTKEQIEELLQQLSKGGSKTDSISILSSDKRPEPRRRTEQSVASTPPISAAVAGRNSVSSQSSKDPLARVKTTLPPHIDTAKVAALKSTPSIKDKDAQIAAFHAKIERLKRLEAERDAHLRLGNVGKKRKKKGKKKKKKKNRSDDHDWDPNRWRTVSGGLPSLGKRR